MRFDRIDGDLPVLLLQLDQALGESDGVLERDVVIHHPVADQQGALESGRMFDR